jgi:hypothetical protein
LPSGGSKQKQYINTSYVATLSGSNVWNTFSNSSGFNDQVLDQIKGSGTDPLYTKADSGILIPKGYKINKIVTMLGSAPTDVELNFIMKINTANNDDYNSALTSDFNFIELYRDNYLNNSTLPVYTTTNDPSKRTFIMPTAGGVNEAANQDVFLILYIKPVGGTISFLPINLMIEIEEI